MCLAIKIECEHIFIFLAKLSETYKLSDGWCVWRLQRVNYVTPYFSNKNNVNKVDMVIPECSN